MLELIGLDLDARPLVCFLNEQIRTKQEKSLIAEWLSRHSQFKFLLDDAGKCRARINRKKADKAFPVPVGQPFYNDPRQGTSEANLKAARKVDEDASIKLLRGVFEQYARSRSPADYAELCEQLRQLHEFGITNRVIEQRRAQQSLPLARFVQGGAPGLGKRHS
tara:strand:+ start:2758 stop:3249 length:492 start_codon:yes stop_codon:yes gene_type:complete